MAEPEAELACTLPALYSLLCVSSVAVVVVVVVVVAAAAAVVCSV